MSERGWKFAEDWVDAHIRKDTLDETGEITDLADRVHALRDRLFEDAKREGITPVEIEEFYDLNNYIGDAVARAQKGMPAERVTGRER